MLILDEVEQQLRKLSAAIDVGVEVLKSQSVAVADAEMTYRRAKSEAWVRCPNDAADVRAGEREWTAARREAWVDAETAGLRRDRDLAEAMRDSAREAVRARQAQLSALQSLLRAHQAEAELAKTGPQWTP